MTLIWTAFFLIPPWTASGQAADPAALEQQVRKYVPLLKQEDTRPRAWDRLSHLGKGALPHLENAELDDALLRSLRDEIALHEALGERYGPLRLFTFDGNEDTLGNCLARLESGGGVTFHKHSVDLGQKLVLRVDDGSFWESLDALCRAAAVTYYPGSSDPIYLSAGLPAPKPRDYHGPVMILLDRVIQQRRVTFDRTVRDFTIRLQCAWDRQVSPLGLNRKYRLVRVADDTGASLIGESPAAAEPVRRASVIGFPLQAVDLSGLRLPSPEARKLTHVEGSLELEFPARIDVVKFPPSAEGAPITRDLDGVSAELRSLVENSGGLIAEFALRFRDEKEAAAHRVYLRDVEFALADDRKTYVSITSAQTEKNVCTFSVRCQRSGDLKEIRLRIPRGSVIKNIPFRFRDVELK